MRIRISVVTLTAIDTSDVFDGIREKDLKSPDADELEGRFGYVEHERFHTERCGWGDREVPSLLLLEFRV